MSHQKSLSVSERSARALLSAWNSGELIRLEAALDQTAAMKDSQPSSSELERIELVREIADSIRLWIEGVKQETPIDLNASLKLLRHLAGASGRAAVEAAKPAPRSEMPVYARR
jgi:hypothetical protein